jgi:hypothetical protein
VHRRHIELQIRAIIVTYRIERQRRYAPTMKTFVARANAILDELESEMEVHPDLTARLLQARQELEAVPSAPPQERAAALRARDRIAGPKSGDQS